eukprot:TRINITY_DN121582_c0_g1_i1.p1 TRINITY_DN121582_c0_g1~~TRINITY_DN121582_c0_g1_i1.p1  ORF type:complete len:930 (+),score=56.42 TRINITY_DN121582_c0_g1_i1:119-2908(+)
MNTKILFFFLFIAFVCCDLDKQPLTPNVPTEVQSLSRGEKLYYSLLVPLTVPPAYLVLDLYPLNGQMFEHDLFVSDSNSSTIKAECYKTEERVVCLLPKELVTPNNTVHINLHCKDKKCNYTLNAIFAPCFNVTENSIKSEYVQPNEARMFSFEVSNDTSIASFYASLVLSDVNLNKVNMILMPDLTHRNNDAKPTIYLDSIRTSNGFYTKVANSSDLFCLGCKYLVLALFQTQTSYTFEYKSAQSISELPPKTVRLTDVFTDSKRNCYKYNVGQKNTLSIYVKPYGGSTIIAVNPLKIPKDVEDFKYVTFDGKFTDKNNLLSISPKDRNIYGDYYVCVFGEDKNTAYDLAVSMEETENIRRYQADPTVVRTMSLSAGELIFFGYWFDNLYKSMEFSISTKNDKTDFFVKECMCNATVVDCNSFKDNMINLTEFSHSTGNSLKVSADFLRSECAGNGLRCGYLIGVYTKNDTTLTESILNTEQIPINIQENTPYLGYVGPDEEMVYTFALHEGNYSSVVIELNILQGSPEFSVKKGDKNKEGKGKLHKIITFNKSDEDTLEGTYRVRIGKETPSVFTLTYYTNNAVQKAGTLTNVLQTSSLTNKETLYSFGVTQRASLRDDLRVFFRPLSGAYQVSLSFNETSDKFVYFAPDYYNASDLPNNTAIGSASGFLLNSERVRPGTYELLVSKYNASDNVSSHNFAVKYSTGLMTPRLLENMPETANLTQNEASFYTYYPSDLSDVEFRLISLTGIVNLYVTLNPLNKLPLSDVSNFSSITTGIVRVPAKNISASCRALSTIYECAVYVGVQCITKDCTYFITAAATHTPPIPEPSQWSWNFILLYSTFAYINNKLIVVIPAGGFILLLMLVCCCCFCRKRKDVLAEGQDTKYGLMDDQKEMKEIYNKAKIQVQYGNQPYFTRKEINLELVIH